MRKPVIFFLFGENTRLAELGKPEFLKDLHLRCLKKQVPKKIFSQMVMNPMGSNV